MYLINVAPLRISRRGSRRVAGILRRMAIYCALGDSMSIDEYAGGAGQGAASLLAARLGHTLHVLARDGATSDDVVSLQLDQLADAPDLVTLTMGGNDLLTALFSPAGPAELVATDMTWLAHKIAGNTARVLDRLVGTGALVAVSTVYDPTDGTGDLSVIGLPPLSEGIALLAAVNDGIRTAAAGYGAVVADVHATFLGHGLTAGDITAAGARPTNRNVWFCGHDRAQRLGRGRDRRDLGSGTAPGHTTELNPTGPASTSRSPSNVTSLQTACG